MAKQQKYGLKFPIVVNEDRMTLFDLNYSRAEKVKSDIMHVIFTPKGQRIRQPNFGTNLIRYIFNPSDMDTWGDIVSDIKETVKTWLPYCSVSDVEVSDADNGLTLYVLIRYTVSEIDGSTGNYELITKL